MGEKQRIARNSRKWETTLCNSSWNKELSRISVYIQGRQDPTSPSSYGHHPGNGNEAISEYAMMDIRKAKRQTKEADTRKESLKCIGE